MNSIMKSLNCCTYNVKNSSHLKKDRMKIFKYKQKSKNNLKLINYTLSQIIKNGLKILSLNTRL